MADEPICASLRPLFGLSDVPAEKQAAPAPAAASEAVGAGRQSPVAIAAAPLLEERPIPSPAPGATAEATGRKSPAAAVAASASPGADPAPRALTPVQLVERPHSRVRSG